MAPILKVAHKPISFFRESKDYCLPPLGQTPVAPFKFEIILHLAFIRLGASIINNEIMRVETSVLIRA